MKPPQNNIARNRKASFNYHITSSIEAGIALLGTEIKSLRQNGCDLSESFVRMSSRGEAWVEQMDIPPYSHGNILNHERTRKRKLLLHRREIDRLRAQIEQKGLSCIPTRIYLKKGRAKLEIGVGRPKKTIDKRQTIQKREVDRQLSRITKVQSR